MDATLSIINIVLTALIVNNVIMYIVKSLCANILFTLYTLVKFGKDQIPLRYPGRDRSEAGRRPVADLLARASSLLAR